jgi:hypothetical protein
MLLLELLAGQTVRGDQLYTTAGTFSFVVPNGVGSICTAAVGAGGAGGGSTASYGGVGGAGGALVYGNNIPVTPGETLTVEIGTAGTSSAGSNGTAGGYTEIRRGATVLLRAPGGLGGVYVNTTYAGLTTAATSANIGGYPYNQGGGNGGGAGYATWGGSGGGGAGGFSGAGGTSGTEAFSYPGGDITFTGGANGARMLASYQLDIYYAAGTEIRRTYDFSTFTTVRTTGNIFTYILRVLSNQAPLIATATGGEIAYFNGTSWTSPSTGTSENIFCIADLTAASGYTYAGCSNGTIIVNSAQSNWNGWNVIGPGTTGTSATLLGNIFLSASGAAQMLFAGSGGTLLMQTYTGPSGPTPPPTTYSLLTSGTTENLWGVAYNNDGTSNGICIVCGTNGTILRSTGASSYTSWTSVTSGTPADLFRATYYNGVFYCVGGNGTIVKSTNGGLNWTTVTVGVVGYNFWAVLPPTSFVGEPIYGLLYNKGVFPMSATNQRWYNCKLDFNMTGSNGAGGGGGGGAGSDTIRAGGGGGVGVTGTGSSGTGGTFTAGNAGAGTGGSSGATGTAGTGTTTGGLGGNYGAGGAGAARGGSYAGASGAGGAMRLIWGPGRSFPSGT